jgi:enoyl-CoA hydratase
VIVTAAPRAFSAGGDIRALYDLGKAGRHSEALHFWRDEYALNTLIKRYPKPYVALIDGIVMGGGVGVSIHGSHRVAGDKFQFAMPEVGIGFFPDVGATWFLPRLPGELGTYCALTGERMRNADAVAAGVATQYVSSARFPELIEALAGTVPVDAVVSAFAEKLGIGPISVYRQAIDRLFVGGSVEAIIQALDREAISRSSEAGWAGATSAGIRGKSPTSLKLALAQLRRGKEWTFTDCMKAEYRIVSRIIYRHDFYEGVRAVIIDKDNAPRWKPERLAQVEDADVESYFAPLDAELELP